MTVDNPKNHWDEETSKRDIDYRRYFVPAGEYQMWFRVNLLRDCLTPD